MLAVLISAFKGPLELNVHAHLDTNLQMTPRPVKISMNVILQAFAVSIVTMKEDLLGVTVMKGTF